MGVNVAKHWYVAGARYLPSLIALLHMWLCCETVILWYISSFNLNQASWMVGTTLGQIRSQFVVSLAPWINQWFSLGVSGTHSGLRMAPRINCAGAFRGSSIDNVLTVFMQFAHTIGVYKVVETTSPDWRWRFVKNAQTCDQFSEW